MQTHKRPSHLRPWVGAPPAVEIDPAAAGPTDQAPAGYASSLLEDADVISGFFLLENLQIT